MSANIILPNGMRSFTTVVASAERMFADGLLGKIFHDTASGGNQYRLVYSVNGVTPAYSACQLDTSEGNSYTVEICATTGNTVGFAQAIITSASYGFIQVAGEGQVLCASTAAVGALLVPAAGTAGQVDDIANKSITATMSYRLCGILLEANGTAGQAATAFIKNII